MPESTTPNKIIGAFALRGENSLEAYSGDILNHGDAAVVFTTVDTKTYTLDANSGAVEDTHLIIAPSVNAGTKRWIWVSTEDSNNATIDYVNTRVADASNITTGTLPSSVLPPIAITTVYTAADQAEMLALTTQEGDVVVRTDLHKSYIRNTGTDATMTSFTELQTPTDSVLSVNTKTGSVVLTQDDIPDGATFIRSTAAFTTALEDIINALPLNYLRSNENTSHTNGSFKAYVDPTVLGTLIGTPTTGFEVFQPTAGKDAFITCHVGGDYAAHIGVSGADNDWFVGGYSMGAVKHKLHHEGNNPASVSVVGSTLLKRDAAGHGYLKYLFSEYVNMTHNPSGSQGDTIFYSSTDSYIRKNNLTGFLKSLGFNYLNGTTGQAYYSDYGLKAQWGYSSPEASQTWVYFPTNFDAGQQHVRVFLQMKTGSSTDLIAKVLTVYSNAFAWGITLNNGWVQTTGVYWLAIGLN